MIAAALIAKILKYGFADLEYQEPFNTKSGGRGRRPRLIAKASEISVEELKELNPELEMVPSGYRTMKSKFRGERKAFLRILRPSTSPEVSVQNARR
jgi:hypothetical protein